MIVLAFRLTAGRSVGGIGIVTLTTGRSRVEATGDDASEGSSGR